MLIVELQRAFVFHQRRAVVPILLERGTSVVSLRPFRLLRVAEAGAMQRGKRRTILHIRGDGADDDLRAGAFAEADDVAQVGVEVRVNLGETRIAPGDLLVKEHLHAFPARGHAGLRAELEAQRIEELTDSCGFECEVRADEAEARRLIAEDRSGTERAHDLVVTHVENPVIATLARAVLRDLADDVGVDGGHGGVDDFDFLARHRVAQEHFEDAREAERRLWIAHRRGFAEHEDAERIGRLHQRKHDGLRRAFQSGWEVAPRELLVLYEHRAAVHLGLEKERRGIANTQRAQQELEENEPDHRDKERDEAEPTAAMRMGGWLRGRRRKRISRAGLAGAAGMFLLRFQRRESIARDGPEQAGNQITAGLPC